MREIGCLQEYAIICGFDLILILCTEWDWCSMKVSGVTVITATVMVMVMIMITTVLTILTAVSMTDILYCSVLTASFVSTSSTSLQMICKIVIASDQ